MGKEHHFRSFCFSIIQTMSTTVVSLFFKMNLSCSLSMTPMHAGKKQQKHLHTILLTVNTIGTDKRKLLVFWKFNRPRCFDKTFQPSTICDWYANKKV